MDPKAPLTVAQGTFITSVSTAFLASAYGTVKGLPIGPLSASTAVNSAIVGATFFSIREYVISPLLLLNVSSPQFTRRWAELEASRSGKAYEPEQLSWADMRMHKLPDTFLSGAISGGVLNAWKRGPRGILPGMVTASIVCTLLQLGYNEIGVARIRYVSRQLQASSQKLQIQPNSNEPLEPPKSISDRVAGWLGISKVSDEEYLRRLKRQRENYLVRIAELEKEKELELVGQTSGQGDESKSIDTK
ncbi:hypothetical protein C8Q75DRAFT_9599 [Abortiporus biennis]|nr:hypothetical protein C8Q75DRAFT_9599 [Abortiporus biennis]